jgi:hypothetical protein
MKILSKNLHIKVKTMKNNLINKFFFLFILGSIFSLSHASITEVHSLKEISLENKRPNMVVFLDVDENLLLNAHHTPQPFRYLAPSHQSHRLLEPDIAQTTTNIKYCVNGDSGKVFMFGLTKRCLNWGHKMIPDDGHEHLQQAGIPLSRQRFKHLDGTSLCGNPYAGFKNGVIYTAGQPKSIYASGFFKLTGIKPSRIVFSDDLMVNIDDMVQYGKKNNVPVEAYHMTRVPLLHDFVKGTKRDTRLPAHFDPDQYLHDHLDVFQAVAHQSVTEQFNFAQHHYLNHGKNEGRFSGYPQSFTPHNYLAKNHDLITYVQHNGLDPVTFAWSHYKQFGHRENRPF